MTATGAVTTAPADRATPADTAIVIGTYNNAAHIAATIASVRAQRYPHWCCLIVDNGSHDESAALALELIAGDARFSVFRKDNEGPSSGRNFGFSRLPTGIEFVHFLDGDDALDPGFLERLVAYLEAHPQVGLVGCQFDVLDADGHRVGPGHRSRWAPSRLGLPRALRDDEAATPFEAFFAATGQGPFAVFRREVLARTGGYEVDFWSHEDSDIFCQMALLAAVHYLPERLYLKRTHAHNLTGSSRADYGKFRRKWDNYRSDDPATAARIESALAYYYGRHAPLRHFKVGLKAAGEFLRTRKGERLRWCLQCLGRGIADLVFRRALRERLLQRRQGVTGGGAASLR